MTGPLDSSRHTLLRGAGRLSAAAALGAGAVLSGCGFRLRGERPLAFSSLGLTGFSPQSGLPRELRRELGGRAELREGVTAGSDLTLQALLDVRERVVTGLTASGLVRDVQLRLRLRYQVRNAAGREVIGPTDLVLSRDMTTTESAVLAKEREQAEIFRALERDVAQRLLRRLEALGPDALKASAAGGGHADQG